MEPGDSEAPHHSPPPPQGLVAPRTSPWNDTPGSWSAGVRAGWTQTGADSCPARARTLQHEGQTPTRLDKREECWLV